MSKNTRFQTWEGQLKHGDRCPVCWDPLGFRTRSNYCSDRCVQIAKRHREIVRTYAQKLQAIGFRTIFHDGIYAEIGLPHYMERYYPGSSQKIYPLQPYAVTLKTKVASEFWDGITRELGYTVTMAIIGFKAHDFRCYSDACVGFSELLSDLMFLGQGTFLCEGCGCKYFDGELTRIGLENLCCELKQKAFPF